jgi:hypothetical protein
MDTISHIQVILVFVLDPNLFSMLSGNFFSHFMALLFDL